eukprot:scaffold5216_cov36-Phaeocystis_antarctica.AAC.4
MAQARPRWCVSSPPRARGAPQQRPPPPLRRSRAPGPSAGQPALSRSCTSRSQAGTWCIGRTDGRAATSRAAARPWR